MIDPTLLAAMRAAKVQVLWEFQARQVEMHERRLLAVFAASVGGGLTVVASVILERVPTVPGIALAGGLFAVGVCAYVLLRALPRQLEASMNLTLAKVESFMLEGED